MRICFSGAQGTGKTTLVELLSKRLSDYKVAENPRRLLSSKLSTFKINKEGDIYSQSFMSGYIAYEILSNEDILSDRSMLDAFAYTLLNENMSKLKKQQMIKMYVEVLKSQDITFYTPIEFMLEQDGVRDTNLKYQKEVDKLIRRLANKYNVKLIKLTGTVEKRYNKILKTLEKMEII